MDKIKIKNKNPILMIELIIELKRVSRSLSLKSWAFRLCFRASPSEQFVAGLQEGHGAGAMQCTCGAGHCDERGEVKWEGVMNGLTCED